jgi:hypothetical protein
LVAEDRFQLFYNPVDVVALPNYANVIKHPMCFKTMKENATQGTYLLTPEKLKYAHCANFIGKILS